ncbi:MAG: hypothetical protein NTU59_00990, partial [Coprothermobacterota bacterium]|nr:hypothetical protein [Coprothermobacterota bacterium]
LVVYDEKGQPLAWSGELDQAAPAVPQGVLTSARDRGQNRVTWQPRPGVRSAIVVVPYQGARSGFVLAGRSLREAEALSSTLLLLVGFGWLGSLVAVFIATWVSRAVAAKLL